MPDSSFDVVVIGAGIAGLTAAALARQQGAKTALVATGPGRFIYGAGWFRADEFAHADNAELGKAIAFFRQLSEEADCAFAGNLHQARLLPTVLGDFLPVTLAPSTLWNGAPSDGAQIAVVGIKGLSGFDEHFMAERMNSDARQRGINCHYVARSIHLFRNLGLPLTPTRIANCFDYDAAFRHELATALATVADECDRILVPAILGLESSGKDLATFTASVGTHVGELATLPPSIAAVRVQKRLERHLQNLGIEIFRGFPVRQLFFSDGNCTGLEIDAPGRGTELRATHILLAAGSANHTLAGNHQAGNLTAANISPELHNSPLAQLLAGFRAASELAPAKEIYAA